MKLSEETDTLIRGLKALNAIDLDKLFGSGLTFDVLNFTTGNSLTGQVSIASEDAAPVLREMRKALETTLRRRRAYLSTQMAAIDSLLPGTDTPPGHGD